MQQKGVVVQGTLVYLQIGRDWYVYDTHSHPLGSGAMGTVYLGRSCSDGSRVAIKQVAPQYADIPSVRYRARLEGSLAFRHQNLIEMIGCCEYNQASGKGPMWIVSRLVQGRNLDEFVNQYLISGKDSVQKIVATMYPVLDALEYLHGGQILHLDIKPSNIMVENGFRIRLMDLGIAATGNSDSPQLIGLLGTPQYAAPEQYILPCEDYPEINATTDIYQVGVTLYELLSQSNPYIAPTVLETMELHKKLPLPESESVPIEILKVLRKATAPAQGFRFQSARDFSKALKEAVKVYEERLNHKWYDFLKFKR